MIARNTTLAAIATTRFGLGARPGEIAAVALDPRGWLLGQTRPGPYAAPAELAGLAPATAILAQFQTTREQRAAQQKSRAAADQGAGDPVAQLVVTVREQLLPHYLAQAAARTRISLTSAASFRERLVQFWSNHFAVSVDKPITLGVAGAMENEAIRPHVTSRFRDLLVAVETHPAMITYLDNQRSAGPNSLLASRLGHRSGAQPALAQRVGINENLAREVLELHTLGVDGGYTQQDVTTFAAVLSGWSIGGGRFPQGAPGSFQFREAIHEPGAKTLLGKRYAEGGFEQGLAVLEDLARHPATARHLSTKLVRHFVTDDPPPALIERLARTFRATDGDLPSVYESLVTWDGAWSPTPVKFKTPRDFAYSALRAFAVVPDAPRQLLAPFELLGQPHFKPGSPAGWPDRAQDWDGADALMKRIEWSVALADRVGEARSALATLDATLGPLARDGLDRSLGPLQVAISGLRQLFSQRDELGVSIDAEDEANVPGAVPAVEMLGLGKVRVASEEERAETGAPAEGSRLVDEARGHLVRWTVTTSIDQKQRLLCVGQRDDQGVVSPDPVIGQINALLAGGVSPDDGAIGVDDRFLEELLGLLFPDAKPGLVDRVHQLQDIARAEPPAEISGRGRIGDPLGAQGIEVDLVVASQFEMLELRARKTITYRIAIVWNRTF